MRAIIKDPLFFFLIAGAALFVVAQLGEPEEISYDIDISEAEIQRLGDQWVMQMRRQPTDQEMRGLVEQLVKEEIYYREARRLNLDVDDTIVRRRMVQKLTFLTEDIATAAPFDEPSLRAYYDEHIDRYRLPDRVSFRHRYFSSDRRDDAEGDATAALADADNLGDPFMLQKSYALRSEREIGDLFGRDFAAALAQLGPAQEWQGPVRSAYGWHAVLVTAVEKARAQPFADVSERVLVDAQQSTREAANQAYYEDLKSRYIVSFPSVAAE